MGAAGTIRPAGEAPFAAGAAVATPVDDDSVGCVDQTLDGVGREQDPGAMAGAVNVEHAVHRTAKVDPW